MDPTFHRVTHPVQATTTWFKNVIFLQQSEDGTPHASPLYHKFPVNWPVLLCRLWTEHELDLFAPKLYPNWYQGIGYAGKIEKHNLILWEFSYV